ncbi:hypothetical protein B0H19DRAFT_1271765 [Mycena capillaripes]|nr:hypothetical protein B0H19DRAFT_1271765 [Mycena capillaripes]
MQPVNASAFDWWYFDVVATTPGSLASVVVVFFTAPSTTLYLSVSFPNGTFLTLPQPFANNATVTTEGNGSSGNWSGSGFSWSYSPYLGYTILIDSLELDVQGSINLTPVSSAHYPCGPAVAGQNMQVGPHIGWANAVPDAASTVGLVVGGTPLAFSGAGYHDKVRKILSRHQIPSSIPPPHLNRNWSDQPFTENVASWYWGHGRLGPYSIVWFDFLAVNGTEYHSGPSHFGRRERDLPPHLSTPNPSGYTITLDLGAEGVLDMNVSVIVPIVSGLDQYTRSVGNITGSLVTVSASGEELMSGIALFEQFKVTE